MLVPLLGLTVTGYFVTICFPAAIGVAIWGLFKRSPWLMITSSLLCMFVSVGVAAHVGLLGLPLPLLLFILGFWRLVRGKIVSRLLLTLLAGVVYVVLAFRLVVFLIH